MQIMTIKHQQMKPFLCYSGQNQLKKTFVVFVTLGFWIQPREKILAATL